jgi:hypothetical protein
LTKLDNLDDFYCLRLFDPEIFNANSNPTLIRATQPQLRWSSFGSASLSDIMSGRELHQTPVGAYMK